MSNSWFRFKQFRVEQSGAAMKVGTDGVLLGAWLRVNPSFVRYLDIGTGTGLISLMVAQRVAALSDYNGGVEVDAVEADAESASQAQSNVEVSAWDDMINVYALSVQNFAVRSDKAGLYDHIFSNPPWFVDDLESPCEKRTAARHAVGLTYGELIDCTCRLLKKNGLFSVVLPAANYEMFENEASRRGMAVVRRTMVCTLPGATPKRVLIEFGYALEGIRDVVEDQITIESGVAVCYTEQYRSLTGDFYLKF